MGLTSHSLLSKRVISPYTFTMYGPSHGDYMSANEANEIAARLASREAEHSVAMDGPSVSELAHRMGISEREIRSYLLQLRIESMRECRRTKLFDRAGALSLGIAILIVFGGALLFGVFERPTMAMVSIPPTAAVPTAPETVPAKPADITHAPENDSPPTVEPIPVAPSAGQS